MKGLVNKLYMIFRLAAAVPVVPASDRCPKPAYRGSSRSSTRLLSSFRVASLLIVIGSCHPTTHPYSNR